MSKTLFDCQKYNSALKQNPEMKHTIEVMKRTVFLRQIYSKLVQDISCVAGQRSKQRAIAIHHNEAELIVVC